MVIVKIMTGPSSPEDDFEELIYSDGEWTDSDGDKVVSVSLVIDAAIAKSEGLNWDPFAGASS